MFGPSITRNLFTRALTICQVQLVQSTALEPKPFDLRSLSPALRNVWLFLVLFTCTKTHVTQGVLLLFCIWVQIQLSKPIPTSLTGEEQIVVVPILHDIQNNTVQQAEVPPKTTGTSSSVSSTHTAIVTSALRRWSEVTPRTGEAAV